MSGISLDQAQLQLDTWLDANIALAAGRRVTIGDRTLERSDLAQVQAQIEFWNIQVQRLTSRASGRGRIGSIVSARG